jgi:hypothetical protein
VPEFKIEGDAIRREVRVSVLSWSTVIALGALTVCLLVLHSARLGPDTVLRSVALVSFFGAFFGLFIVATREGLSYASDRWFLSWMTMGSRERGGDILR